VTRAGTPDKVTRDWVDVQVAEQGSASTMPAYLARPAAPGTYPNVIVGFEMFGVTEYIRAVTDRVAGLGYTAVAPDFYHRLGNRIDLPATSAGRDRGLGLLQELHREGALRDMGALLGYLSTLERGCTRTAMIGLSVGGHLAYYAATQLPLAALAVFYPGWLTDTGIALSRPEPTLTLTPAIARLGTRVLFLLGEADHLFTAAQRTQIAEQLRDAGVDHELVVYPDAPHGFFCHERDTFRPAAAKDAFGRVAALLATELAPGRGG